MDFDVIDAAKQYKGFTTQLEVSKMKEPSADMVTALVLQKAYFEGSL